MPGKTLLIGTGNRGKAVELASLLEDLPWTVKNLSDFPTVPEPVEDGNTFESNAIKKACYFRDCFEVDCVADDSGLVVDALGGAPGVFSARYAGDRATDLDNNAKLLAALAPYSESERMARFVCCIAFVRPGGEPHIETGVAEGRIAFAPRGPRGFGYDPLFIPEGFTETFAEMGPAQKLTLSHRGRALRKLLNYLSSLDAVPPRLGGGRDPAGESFR